MSYCDGGVAGAVDCWTGGGMSTRASQCSIVPWPTQLSVMSPAFSVALEFGGAIVPLKPLAEMRQAGFGFEFGTSEVARTQVISAGPAIVNLSGCAPELVSTHADMLWTTPWLRLRCAWATRATADNAS